MVNKKEKNQDNQIHAKNKKGVYRRTEDDSPPGNINLGHQLSFRDELHHPNHGSIRKEIK